jgi:hypothetical protein
MDHYEKVPFVVVPGYVDPFVHEELGPCPFKISQIVRVVDNTSRISVLIINLEMNAMNFVRFSHGCPSLF